MDEGTDHDPPASPAEPTTDEPSSSTQATNQPQRLLRRSSQGPAGGVAAGLANYLGVEPLLFRLVFVVLTLFSGAGILLYGAGWLLLPTDDDPDRRPLAVTSNAVALIAGFGALAVGLLLLAEGVTLGPSVVIPVTMLLFGVWVLSQRSDAGGRGLGATEAGGAAGATPTAAPPPPMTPPPPVPFTSQPPPSSVPVPPVAQPRPQPVARDLGAPEPSNLGPHWAQTRLDPQDTKPAKTGPPITSITMAATAVVVGALLVLRNLGDVEIEASVILASIVAVLGAGLVASALYGRALTLVPLAILSVILLLIAPLIDSTVGGGIGTKRVEVSTEAEDLQPSYSLGIGELLVDLRDLEVAGERTVEIDVGAGYTEIVVPRDLRVEVVATNRAGYVEAFGVFDEGVFNEVRHIDEGSGSSTDSLKIIVDVTFGYAEIRRG